MGSEKKKWYFTLWSQFWYWKWKQYFFRWNWSQIFLWLKVSQSQNDFLVSSNLPKRESFLRQIFALDSKIGQIKKLKTIYLYWIINNPYYLAQYCAVIFLIWPILEARAEICQKRVHFLEDLKTPKFHSENQDVIQLPFLETLTHTYLIHCSRLTRIVSTSLKKW